MLGIKKLEEVTAGPAQKPKELTWLSHLRMCTIAQVAYSQDKKGYQKVYHVLRRAEEKNTLCLLQTDPNGTLRAIDISTFERFFHVENAFTSTSTSRVYTPMRCPKTQELGKRTIGYIEGNSRIVNENRDTLLDICVDGEGGINRCYYLHKHGLPSSPVTKISSILTHHFLLVQFGSNLSVVEKAMVIGFAKKTFSGYFQISLKNLVKCKGSMTSLQITLGKVDNNPLVAVQVVNAGKEIKIPERLLTQRIGLPTSPVVSPSPAPIDQITICKVALIHSTRHHLFVVRSVPDERPLFLIDSQVTPKQSMVRVKEYDSLSTLFQLDNISPHDNRSRVSDSQATIGYIAGDRIFDSANQEAMYATALQPPVGKNKGDQQTCSILECGLKDKCAVAFISFNSKERRLSVTSVPTIELQNKNLVLAFSLKILHTTFKLDHDKAAEVVSIEDAVNKKLK